MAEITLKAIISEADLLHWDAEDLQFEVVNGEVIEMSPTGLLHNAIVMNIYDILKAFVKKHRLGYVGGDGMIYLLQMGETGVQEARVPDVSFFRRGKFPRFDYNKPVPGAPDLAVEVISPSESAEAVQDKLRSYFAHGTEQVWLVYPQTQIVYQHLRADPRNIRVYSEADILEPEPLFPGLRITVAEFFAAPDLE